MRSPGRLSADLALRLEQAEAAGSRAAVDRQHERGKLTARERIALLVDPGSFVETGALVRHRAMGFGIDRQRPYGDGVVTGHATVDGRPVCLFAHDFTVFGGSLGEGFGEKVIAIMDLAAKIGCPIIGLNDSGGARIQEGVVSLAYYAEIGRRNAQLSGIVPQISLILGPCAGGAVYSPAMTDVIVMVEAISHMFVTGPDVVAQVTGERTTHEELGGALTNASEAGNAHYVASSEKDAFEWTRVLLSHLPSNHRSLAPDYPGYEVTGVTEADRALDTVIPERDVQLYDMQRVIRGVLDDGEFLELHELYGTSVLVGLGRVEGHSVGVVANQPLVRGGVLDIDASEKAARFVRFCDAFGLPILTFVDVPGYLPGIDQERRGIIRRGAKLFYAYSTATVPKLTVVTRKAFGGGYAVMGSKHLGADLNLAWPTAQIAVMGAEGAVEVLHARAIAAAAADDRADEMRERLVREYREQLSTPYLAAERGYVDEVIAPHRTRWRIAQALRRLRGTRSPTPDRVHGNIPL